MADIGGLRCWISRLMASAGRLWSIADMNLNGILLRWGEGEDTFEGEICDDEALKFTKRG